MMYRKYKLGIKPKANGTSETKKTTWPSMSRLCKNIAPMFAGVKANSSRYLVGHHGKMMLGSPAEGGQVIVILTNSHRSLSKRYNGFAV